MIDAESAREIVRDALRHAEDGSGVRCVLVGETLDYGAWWVQGYQSEAFAVFTLSSAEPVDEQMARLAAAG